MHEINEGIEPCYDVDSDYVAATGFAGVGSPPDDAVTSDIATITDTRADPAEEVAR